MYAKVSIYLNHFYITAVKYFYEIMIGVSVVALIYALFSWFSVESMEWKDIKATLLFNAASICLFISFIGTYAKQKKQ